MNASLLRGLRMRRAAWFVSACMLAAGCGLQLKPLMQSGAGEQGAARPQADPRVVFRFFDEDFVAGGYEYGYPEASKVFIPEESGKHGEVALQFDLAADDYSGGSVCLYNLLYDLRPYLSRGALDFWIKGAAGGEVAWVALVDEENTDGKKTVVRLPLARYGGITTEWTRKTIPLADFGAKGVYWDAKKRVEVAEPFAWDKVAEFRIEIKKGDNASFRVWADDIFILRDAFEERRMERRWEDTDEPVAPPPRDQAPPVTVVRMLFDDGLPPGGSAYVYGGKTAFRVAPTGRQDNKAVLATYQDNSDYSGVSVVLGPGNNLDLSALRATHAGLAFWAKAGPGVTKAFVGLLDDELDGRKVQTKVLLGDFGALDTSWKYFMVPLKSFAAQGLYWDAAKRAEISGDVDWRAINEVRFSVNRFENRTPEGEPAVIHIDQLAIIADIPGWVDPDEYWNAFVSSEPDLLVHDFETPADHGWEAAAGPKSEIAATVGPAPQKLAGGGKAALVITYRLGDYADAFLDYAARGVERRTRDWTKHWGLKFQFYTSKPYQAITVQVSDAGNEVFVCNAGAGRGWNEILVPFRQFSKFPYYQPDDAVQNGVFDLDGVRRIDFKPAGEGTSGVWAIDNVALTNDRAARQPQAPAAIAVTVRGTDSVVTERINGGLFGINAALWDGDLLLPATIKHVKAAGHGVVRYPGGLRADEDHWDEVLARKDWMVDSDEFLEFCRAAGATAMITVNFGRGTPEQAAAWVRHVNVTRGAGVKLWEIGNELYGDWHPNHCTPEEYGRRSAAFIKAMKAVDPSIKVGVVWVLDGEWNRVVFDHVRDLADAVVVHHYPQHAREENDLALLAAPQTLDEIIPSVRRQAAQYGAPGRAYEVWLTEWNSVDTDPGPQTLGVVNGLFVIDYLGVLARHNIEQASYWDIHNSLTPRGGDYGYLSRTGAPDGDNVPRPSYWAFRLASQALRGSLLASQTTSDDVTAYLTRDGGRRTLLLVNKSPQSAANVTLDVPGLAGDASLAVFPGREPARGLAESRRTIKTGDTIELAPFSAVSITVGAER